MTTIEVLEVKPKMQLSGETGAALVRFSHNEEAMEIWLSKSCLRQYGLSWKQTKVGFKLTSA